MPSRPDPTRVRRLGRSPARDHHCLRLRYALLFGFLVLAANAYAQVDRGALAGTVKDSSGLAVPGATIEATQTTTSLRRSSVTSNSGTYDIPELPVGRYTVAVRSKGLQTVTIENVLTSVEHTTILNVTLHVSGTTESVEVTESDQQLDQNSNTLGARLERKQASELLLNGRNWATLTLLAPLAVDTNYGNSSNQRSIRVAGRGRDDNNFTYDGVDATNIINQAQQPYVRLAIPLDTIQEFRVVSMLATPEAGATAGAQLSVTSSSGTNQFHGDAFDFVRNDALDARSFIDPVKRPFHLNQFGASAGGPIVRDKTFFFAAYEGYRQNLGQTLVGFVPTDAFRRQVASQSPALAPVVDAYPEGVLPVANNPNVAEFIGEGSQIGNEDSGMIRVDHRFSDDRTTVFGRANIDRAQSSAPLANSSQYLKDVQVLNSAPANAAIELLHVFSPALVSESKFGFNRSTAYTTNANETGALYSFSVPGFTTLNNDRISIGAADTFAGIENLTKVAGRHLIKAGVEMRRVQMNQGRTASGSVSFSSLSAFAADNVNTASFTQALPVNGLRKFTYFGYLQDEFKWTPTLTLNVGARYSFFNIFHEVNGRANPFDFATCGPTGFCGVGASFGQPNYRDIDPRVAVAWAPGALHGKTVIRTGFGTYHQDGQLDDQNVPESNEVMNFSLSQKTIPGLNYPVDPFLAGVAGVISPSAMQRDRKDMYVTQWGLSVQQSLPFSIVATASYVGSKGTHLLTLSYVNVIDPLTGQRPYPQFGQISWRGNESNSTYQGLQASLQRTFKNGLLFSLNYTFSHELDNGSMGSGDGDSLTPEIVGCAACDRSSGTFDVRHVLNANTVYELPFGRGKPYLSDPGVLRGMFGGWQVTSIITARTGFPVNVTVDRSAASVPDGNTNNQRPNLAPGVPLVPPGGSTSAEWINLAAFTTPAAGTFGNVGRDILRGPGLWQVDFGLAKRIALTERCRLQFRAEAFNVFNRAQLAAPQSDISAGPGEFGRIIQPVNTTPIGTGTPRQIQLALRFEF
jgi:hypothetical protein